MKYSQERKEAVLRKMMPPHNRSISQLAKEEGISDPTLYNWRNEARRKGILLPDSDASPEGWTARDKFAAVIETAALNEEQTAEYCRRKGIYPEQLKLWRGACEAANDWDKQAGIKLNLEQKTNRKRIKHLEKELQRKEKALAEAAALLVLQKKVQAI
ncbi:Transposase [Desulfopila aestuarii DSM 18488]|uniref:Transposase n=1 Tax=Desulfopila aestuarii DSM 18488 TaxID=1121416 RepID=A0A1M7YFR0_9BACT|nr:Transposase [Desulfopila aestuarii DSM 18488]